jgi:hypothetical protein
MSDSTATPYRRFLRTNDAAAFVGLSPRTLEALRLNGGGPVYCRPPGRRLVVYDRRDLEAWARAGRRSSTSEAPAST